MFTYKNRDTFLQKLHPLTTMFFIITYIILFLKINNPVYIFIILLSVLLIAYEDGCIKGLLSYGKLIVPIALLIMVLNPILVHNGETIIYKGHINFPVIGYIVITLEAIIYGIFNGIRIFCITMILGFGNFIIHPDRAFGYFSKFFKNSSLLMSMTIRLFPTLMESYENISDVEKMRGNKIFYKDMKKSIKSSGNIVNILFLSSLEDSADMAESMYSRGYGACKKRSSYFIEKFTLWDYILMSILILILILLQYLSIKGFNNLNFYPKVDNPIEMLSKQGIIMCILTFLPAILNWGWKHWK